MKEDKSNGGNFCSLIVPYVSQVELGKCVDKELLVSAIGHQIGFPLCSLSLFSLIRFLCF